MLELVSTPVSKSELKTPADIIISDSVRFFSILVSEMACFCDFCLHSLAINEHNWADWKKAVKFPRLLQAINLNDSSFFHFLLAINHNDCTYFCEHLTPDCDYGPTAAIRPKINLRSHSPQIPKFQTNFVRKYTQSC